MTILDDALGRVHQAQDLMDNTVLDLDPVAFTTLSLQLSMAESLATIAYELEQARDDRRERMSGEQAARVEAARLAAEYRREQAMDADAARADAAQLLAERAARTYTGHLGRGPAMPDPDPDFTERQG